MPLILDVHSHFLPYNVLKNLALEHPELKPEVTTEAGRTSVRVGKGGWSYTARAAGYLLGDISKSIGEMDKHRVDKRVLSIVPWLQFYDLEEKLAMKASILCNNFAAEMMQKHSGRISCMATVPLQSLGAPDELRRSVKDLGLVGVQIGSNVMEKNLDEEEFLPFFETVSELRVPILLHPLNVPSTGRLSKYSLSSMLGNPMETTLAADCLIFAGIFEKFPKLKIILAAGGGYLPYQIGRLDHLYKSRPNRYPLIKKTPSHYFRKMYIDTGGTYNPISLKYLIQIAGRERVILGSDFPSDDSDSRSYILGLHLPKSTTDKILGQTAQRLFFENNRAARPPVR